jgi:hypothetical protein
MMNLLTRLITSATALRVVIHPTVSYFTSYLLSSPYVALP